MQPQTQQSGLLHKLTAASYVPAVVAGGYTFHYLNSTFSDSGLGAMGTALAASGAAGLTSTYGAAVHALFKGLAPLPREDRAGASLPVFALVCAVSLGSAFPNAIVSGGPLAMKIEDQNYIARLTQAGDDLKRAARSAEQIGTIIETGAVQVENLAILEAKGNFGGAPNSGSLAALMASKAATLKAAAQQLSGPRERVADEISRIDQSTDRMRSALLDRETSPEKRRTQMQRHADDGRSAALAIASISPVASLQSLADDLMGPQTEPVWSSVAETRKKQEDGFRKYKDELRRLGKSLLRPTNDLAQGLKTQVPVYDPPPTSLLVIKHAHALAHIWAFALALDGLPLILYSLACAMTDAQRRKISKDLAIESSPLSSVTLGEHPYPASTRARAAITQSQKNSVAD